MVIPTVLFFPLKIALTFTFLLFWIYVILSSGNKKWMIMEKINASSEGYFVLLGFSNWPNLEVVLFVIVLMFYLMTLTGNLFIIILSYLDSHLHTPMYFFLSNLSFLDLCYSTSFIPQLLVNLWGPEKTISYTGCMRTV